MDISKARLLVLAIGIATTSGCATYRTSSNIQIDPAQSVDRNSHVVISEGDLPDKTYREIGPIEVSVKKLTAFHKDPTKEQANEALIERARVIGANAVINVTYKSGVGFSTWGYMDAKGLGVKIAK